MRAIPKNWKNYTFGDIVKFSGGAQPPRSTFLFKPTEGYIRLIQTRDYKSDKYMTFIPVDKARKKCIKDDIMIGRYGPPIFQILRGLEGAYNVALLKAIPDEKKLDKEYLYYFISQYNIWAFIENLSQRSGGQTGVDLEQLRKHSFPLPPLPEQQKIAEILSTVDAKIEIIDQQIAETQEFKKGLMQQLLTKGIGHTEFKDSVLGKIPKSWEVMELDEISSTTRLAGYEYSEYWQEAENGEITALRGYNIGKNKLKLHDVIKISEELSQKLIRSRLFKGNVVFPCVGTIGNAIVIEDDDKYHINQNIAKITPNKDLDSYFLMQYLLSSMCRKEIKRFNATTSQPNVLVGSLRKFRIPFPNNLSEQIQISEILGIVDQKLEVLSEKKITYQEMKQGLMQQLLTGKVRV
jgi:type I restriction enzyme S subunit